MCMLEVTEITPPLSPDMELLLQGNGLHIQRFVNVTTFHSLQKTEMETSVIYL